MKIQKSKSSEIFDLYMQKMHKKAIVSELVDVIKQLYRNGTGLSPEEISKQIIDYTPEQIKQVLGLSDDVAQKLLPTNTPNPKDVLPRDGDLAPTEILPKPKPNPLDEQTGKTLVPHPDDITKNIHNIIPDEILKVGYELISQIENQAKVCITDMKSTSALLENINAGATAEQINKSILQLDTSAAGLRSLLQKDVETLNLFKSTGRERQKIEWAEEVLRRVDRFKDGAKGQNFTPPPIPPAPKVTPPTSPIDEVTEATEKTLKEQGVNVTPQEKTLITEISQHAEASAYYRTLADEAASLGDDVASKAATEASESSAKAANSAISSLSAVNPQAAQAATQAATQASAKGVAKANSALNPPMNAGKNTSKAPSSGDAPNSSGSDPLNVGKNTSKAPSSGDAPNSSGSDPYKARKQELDEQKFKHNQDVDERKYRDDRALRNRELIFNGIPKAVETGGKIMSGLGTLLSLAFTAAIFYGGYKFLQYLLSDDNEETKKHLDPIKQSLKTTVDQLDALEFEPGSFGEQRTLELANLITDTYSSIVKLSDPNLTEEQAKETAQKLDLLNSKLGAYIRDADIIEQDLRGEASKQIWQELRYNSLPSLLGELQGFIEYVSTKSKEAQANNPDEKAGELNPIGTNPNDPANNGNKENVLIPVYGHEINLSNASPGFRSAAPRIIEKVLNTPEGKAFVDPANQWGGWLGNSGDPKTDYLRALKYLYLNRIFDRGDLRKFIRDNMPKAGRKRLSGWKNSVKFYRKNEEKYANNSFFTQKFIKPANSQHSSVSFLEDNLDMIKNADQFSKGYYRDAIKDLDDQYAKSYYASLKGFYDTKPEKTKADYGKLYEVHGETGADLIADSHPKSINLADAMGNGGLVENALEQHRRGLEIAFSVPSGNFRARYAWVIQNLVKLANEADQNGMTEASDLIDATLVKLASL